VDLPIHLVTEGCRLTACSERNKVERECVSGLKSIFRINILMCIREELTSHVVAVEKLLPPPPHFSVVRDDFLHCTVLFWRGRAVRDGAPEHDWD